VTSKTQRTIVFLVPVVVLLTDLWIFPLYETHLGSPNVSLVALLSRPKVELGSLKAHHILVSIDDIRHLRNSGFVRQKSNALIISVFIDEGHDGPPYGALEAAVLAELNAISRKDYFALVNRLSAIDLEPGQVVDFELHVPEENYGQFPIDHLLMVMLPRYHPDPHDPHPDPRGLQKGIRNALELAGSMRLSNVMLPSLGANWTRANPKNAVPFSVFFGSFFDALPLDRRPTNVYLSLYSGWPSSVLEDAVLALNSAWEQQTSKFHDILPLYRRNFRFTVLFLELCLIVCSVWMRLTLKNFLIVAAAFVGLSLGIDKWVELLAPQDSPNIQLIVQLVILTVLSLGFPVVVRWNPKDLFDAPDEE
jgi:hypothetical protein